MVSRRQAFENALSAWREAERGLAAGADGDSDALKAEIERRKNEFHQLSAAHMIERLDALAGAERRRAAAPPSTDGFHEAARDEKRIAAEIWEHARASDEDIPRSEADG